MSQSVSYDGCVQMAWRKFSTDDPLLFSFSQKEKMRLFKRRSGGWDEQTPVSSGAPQLVSLAPINTESFFNDVQNEHQRHDDDDYADYQTVTALPARVVVALPTSSTDSLFAHASSNNTKGDDRLCERFSIFPCLSNNQDKLLKVAKLSNDLRRAQRFTTSSLRL